MMTDTRTLRTFRTLLAMAGAAAALASARPAGAQQPQQARTPKIAGPAALKARATVSGDSATRIARAQVPNGTVQSGEIEEEKGKLIYSFDLKVPGRSGIEEVNVDAMTGAVVAHEHESLAAERKEARDEAREKKAAARKATPNL